MEASALGHVLPIAYATGFFMIAASAAFIAINAFAIRQMLAKKHNLRLNAYGLLVILSLANVAQLTSHAISGVILLAQSEWTPFFVKIVGGNIDAAFDVYCIFVGLLAINRLVAVLWPVKYQSLYGRIGLRFWYGIAFAIWAVDVVIFALPVRSIVYDWDTCGWIWTESRAMRILNKCINLGGYSVAVVLHIAIFVALTFKRKPYTHTMTLAEKNVLLQASFVAVFELAYSMLWHLPFLPRSNVASLFFHFIWLCNCIVSPVAYFLFQKRIRTANKVSTQSVEPRLRSQI